MCRVDDDGDRATVYQIDRPIARAPHRCGECRRTILAGEPYERHRMLSDGFWSLHIICTHCAVLTDWLGKECGGTVCGEMIEDIEEHAREYARSDLQSLASCARLQWRCIASNPKFPGIPVPALPALLSGLHS